MFDFSFALGFVCERRSSPRVLRYPASRRSHARRQRMASRRREDGPPRTRRSCEVGRRRRPLLVLPSGPTSRFFLLSQPTAPPRNPGSRLNTHTTHECHLLVANSKIELADEPLRRTRLARGSWNVLDRPELSAGPRARRRALLTAPETARAPLVGSTREARTRGRGIETSPSADRDLRRLQVVAPAVVADFDVVREALADLSLTHLPHPPNGRVGARGRGCGRRPRVSTRRHGGRYRHADDRARRARGAQRPAAAGIPHHRDAAQQHQKRDGAHRPRRVARALGGGAVDGVPRGWAYDARGPTPETHPRAPPSKARRRRGRRARRGGRQRRPSPARRLPRQEPLLRAAFPRILRHGDPRRDRRRDRARPRGQRPERLFRPRRAPRDCAAHPPPLRRRAVPIRQSRDGAPVHLPPPPRVDARAQRPPSSPPRIGPRRCADSVAPGRDAHRQEDHPRVGRTPRDARARESAQGSRGEG